MFIAGPYQALFVAALFIGMVGAPLVFKSDLAVDYVKAPPSGSEVTGRVDLSVAASSSAFLRSFALSVRGTDLPHDFLDPSLSAQQIMHGPWTNRDAVREDSIVVDWETNIQPDNTFNGTYKLSATATSLDGRVVTRTISELRVNNPPRQPDRPVATASGIGVELSVHGPEPDILRYVIQRSTAGSPFSEINPAPSAHVFCPGSYSDPEVPRGQEVRYQVISIRASPLSADGIASLPSDPSDPVTISDEATPTPTPSHILACTTGVEPGRDFFELTAPTSPSRPAPTRSPQVLATKTTQTKPTTPITPATTSVPTSSIASEQPPTRTTDAAPTNRDRGGHPPTGIIVAVAGVLIAAASAALFGVLKRR
jgi:hypothetical protein